MSARLSIPDVEGKDVLGAAMAYAACGWFVMPVEAQTKRPARILGERWQYQTTQDPEQIVDWFAGTDLALGLHVGRSGAVVFDLDEPDQCPPELAEAIRVQKPPRQSTRTEGERGHVVFAMPHGRVLGNSRGQLRDRDGSGGRSWGEVRGANGFIVVEPSEHSKPGGRYHWTRTGEVPALPKAVADMLPDAGESQGAATNDVIDAFMAAHTGASAPHLLNTVLSKFDAEVGGGSARHEALVTALVWSMREATAGLYPAHAAAEALRERFTRALQGERGRFPRSEFAGALSWAVAQAMAENPEAVREQVERRLDSGRGGVPVNEAGDFDFFGERTTAASQAAPRRNPADYFVKDEGLDVALLADDVIAAGPLRVGKDERFWKYDGGVWVEANDEVRGRCVDLLLGRYRGSHASNVEHVVRRKVGRIHCDPVEPYINFRNGMLDWRTGRLEPHDPSFLSTVQLPLAWDPQATCPDFDAFLGSVLSPDYVDLAWQMIGYLMLSGNPMQVAFLLHGNGENGKGTLLRVVGDLLGHGNYSSASLDSINTNRFTAAQLFGKIANLAGDIDATYQESTAMFKKMTGEDAIDGEHKYGAAFRFVSWAVPVFSANKIPGSADTSAGYLRRWVVLNFAKQITKEQRILGLSDRLRAELPGIAVKAVAALAALMERGRFEIVGEAEQGMQDFATAVDQVRQWVDECCDPDDEGSEDRSLLYKSYRAWADSVGAGRLKATEFYHRLDNAGYKATKVNGVRRHRGLRVKAMRMQPDPQPGDADADFFNTQG